MNNFDLNKTVVPPPTCRPHNGDLMVALGFTEASPWQAALIALALVLVRCALESDTITSRIGDDMDVATVNLVFAECGCLACFRPDWYRLGVDTIQRFGIDQAIDIGMGKRGFDGQPRTELPS